jgi:hypothetical protein
MTWAVLLALYLLAGVYYALDYLEFSQCADDTPSVFFGHLLVAALIALLWPIVLIGRFLAMTR